MYISPPCCCQYGKYFRLLYYLNYNTKINNKMADNQSNGGAPRGRNDDFIRSIKDKYSSVSKPSKRSPSKYLMPPTAANNDRSLDKYKQGSRLNGTPLQNKNTNKETHPYEKSYLNQKEYLTLRSRYEDKDLKAQTYSKDPSHTKKQTNYQPYNDRELQSCKGQLENKGESTNKSSPIKKFYYDSIQKNNENFILTRKSEIEQLHQKRANQQKIEREKTQKTIASIDNLLQNIRKTLHQNQHSR